MHDKNGREINIGDRVQRLKDIPEFEKPLGPENVSAYGTGTVTDFASSTCVICRGGFGNFAVLASTLEVIA